MSRLLEGEPQQIAFSERRLRKSLACRYWPIIDRHARFGSAAEPTQIGDEPDMTLGVTNDVRQERGLVTQGNFDLREKRDRLDRADIADKNAPTAVC